MYTLPRDDQDSEPIWWIRGHTKTGPVHQIRIICCLHPGSYPEAQTATWISTEETPASQPATQSNLISDHSEDFIPKDERKWNDISAYGDVKGKTLESRISKWVLKLVRHLDLKGREIDGGEDSAFPIISSSSSASHEYEGSISMSPGRSLQKSLSSGNRQGRWAHNLWDDGISPRGNTPHGA